MPLYKATVDLLLDVPNYGQAGDVISDFVTDDRILDWQYTQYGVPCPTDGADFPDYSRAQYQATQLDSTPNSPNHVWEVYHLTRHTTKLVYAATEEEAIDNAQ